VWRKLGYDPIIRNSRLFQSLLGMPFSGRVRVVVLCARNTIPRSWLSENPMAATETNKEAETQNKKPAPNNPSSHNLPPDYALAEKRLSGRQFLTAPNLAGSRLWLWSPALCNVDHTATNITSAWPVSPRSVRPFAGLPGFYTISTRIQNAGRRRSWRLTPRHKSARVPYGLLPALLHHLLSSITPTRTTNVFRRGGSSR
jgi:hypothetical protein